MLKNVVYVLAALAMHSCSSDQSHDHSGDQQARANSANHAHAGSDAHSHGASGHSHDSSNFDFQKIKSAAEEGARNFNPAYVRAFHPARVYKIRDYGIVDSLIVVKDQQMPVIKTVAGEIPGENSSGAFEVTFLDEKDNTLYQYRMESPLYVRMEHGPDKGLFKVRNGSFMVPLPPLKNAAKIVLRDNDGTELVSTFR